MDLRAEPVATSIHNQQKDKTVKLFVGNLSKHVDAHYLKRLFSAYGTVKDVAIHPTPELHAVVTVATVDDADTAVAALHQRYCMSANTPIIVLYLKENARISEYARIVAAEFRAAMEGGRAAKIVPLERFDTSYQRGEVPIPPSEFRVPLQGPTMFPSAMTSHAANFTSLGGES